MEKESSVSVITQQAGTHLKILIRIFNRKFANFLSILLAHKTAGSLGALAGFAIAVLFAWKFSLGSRRLRKHTSSASTSGASFSLDGKDREPVDDFRSPEKLALAQMVKKKLLSGRKMTCQLLGVILEESTPEELQEHATVRSPAVEVLLEISKVCDIYLMETILDDDSEERVISALERAGLFEAGGLMKEKVLFCSTQNGRLSFVRQLEPDWHVDTDPDVLSQLCKFVRNQLHISPAGSSFATGSTISSATSLDLYFMGGGV